MWWYPAAWSWWGLPLCVLHKVFVYACIVLCTGSSLGWGVGSGWSIIVRCCSLSVSCISSTVGGLMADFKLMNWSWSCWNFSSNSAKGQWVSVFLLYSLDESLSHLDIVWSDSTIFREAESCGAGHPQHSGFCILWLWCGSCGGFEWCLAEPSGVFVCGLGTCACCSGGADYRRWKSLTRWWLCWALLGWVIFCILWGGSQSCVGGDPISRQVSNWPVHWQVSLTVHCEVSHHDTSVKVQNGVKVQNHCVSTLCEGCKIMVFPR